MLGALAKGLGDLGYVEGRHFAFERRHAGVALERLPDLAAELVRLRPDIIVTGSNPYVAAARRATSTIPIVFIGSADPVGMGFAESLARPGGNATGLAIDASPEMLAKNLALLAEVVPGLSRVGVLRQAGLDSIGFAKVQEAARSRNVALVVVDIRKLDELADGFATLSGKRVDAVFTAGSVFWLRRQQLADLALKHRLPAIHVLRDFAQAGLLMSYGPDLLDLYRRAASYVGKILGGAKPAELPIEQPAKFDLVINLRTAKALGLTVPRSVLLRADEIIQ